MAKGLWGLIVGRDGGCVAPLADPTAGVCRDAHGFERPRVLVGILTVDHVRGQPPIGQLEVEPEGGYGSRAPSDPDHLVALCMEHHFTGRAAWATAHRPLLRAYLRFVNAGLSPAESGRRAAAEMAA